MALSCKKKEMVLLKRWLLDEVGKGIMKTSMKVIELICLSYDKNMTVLFFFFFFGIFFLLYCNFWSLTPV